jgi:hypothetical protein
MEWWIGHLRGAAAVPPRGRTQGTHWTGGWMDSRVGLNVLYKRKKNSLNPTVNRITRFRPLSCKLDTLSTELNRLFEIYVKTENTHGVLPLSNDSLYEG